MIRIGLISLLLGFAIISAHSQDSIISIPDTAFLHALIEEGVDTNEDGLISYGEAIYNETTSFYVQGLNISDKGISDMSGIEAFYYLDTLWCDNNQITSLDLSKNILLRELKCSYNQLTSLDVSGCEELVSLDCYENQLTSLDVSGCTAFKKLDCW